MSLLQAILMGLLQGITEFLPVSSSGHLAIFKYLFNVNTETGLLFDTLLHLGTFEFNTSNALNSLDALGGELNGRLQTGKQL